MIRLALILALVLPLTACATAVAIAKAGPVTITLYTDTCAIDAVKNLPARATWVQTGKEFEGCWGVNTVGIVMLYWNDKTVTVMPIQAFSMAEET